jgi:hypothetical protein
MELRIQIQSKRDQAKWTNIKKRNIEETQHSMKLSMLISSKRHDHQTIKRSSAESDEKDQQKVNNSSDTSIQLLLQEQDTCTNNSICILWEKRNSIKHR